MATFLFDKIIFGPVNSRRLGLSLGINLLPVTQKLCSFDCVYCECGLNTKKSSKADMPSRKTVKGQLEKKLTEMAAEGKLPDVITFAGNGEPTLHPDFPGIIDDTLSLRDCLCPSARIAVLSNATKIQNREVTMALMKIDDNILKLDGGLESTILAIDRPNGPFSLHKLIDQLKTFEGKLIIQTLFLKGEVNGSKIDNTQKDDIDEWLRILSLVKPKSVMIYTISRDTPFDTLQKIDLPQLNLIAQKVKDIGFEVQVSG